VVVIFANYSIGLDHTDMFLFTSDAESDEKIEVIFKLLNKGANINLTDDRGQTVLHKVLLNEDPYDEEVVSVLLENNADPNIADHSFRSPIHYASRVQSSVELLLKFGADPNCVDTNGNTALHLYLWSCSAGITN